MASATRPPRVGSMTYAVASGPTKVCSQVGRPPTRQPVSSGTTHSDWATDWRPSLISAPLAVSAREFQSKRRGKRVVPGGSDGVDQGLRPGVRAPLRPSGVAGTPRRVAATPPGERAPAARQRTPAGRTAADPGRVRPDPPAGQTPGRPFLQGAPQGSVQDA